MGGEIVVVGCKCAWAIITNLSFSAGYGYNVVFSLWRRDFFFIVDII